MKPDITIVRVSGEQRMMKSASNRKQDPVTIVWNWTIKPGKETLFESLMHDIHKVARTFPGHMGVSTLPSPTSKNTFQTVVRFDSVTHLENWLHSDIRQRMIKPVSEIAHEDAATKATG